MRYQSFLGGTRGGSREGGETSSGLHHPLAFCLIRGLWVWAFLGFRLFIGTNYLFIGPALS